MKAYAREYEPYLELINMDINLYIKLVFVSLSEFVFVFIIYLKVLFPGNVNFILTPGIRRCSWYNLCLNQELRGGRPLSTWDEGGGGDAPTYEGNHRADYPQ